SDADGIQLDEPHVDGITSGDTTITGTGNPGASVSITSDDGVIGIGTVDASGKFKIQLDRAAKAGEELVFAQYEVDEDGATIDATVSDPVTITVSEAANDGIVVEVGNNGSDGSNGSTVGSNSGHVDGSTSGDELPNTATSTFNWIMGGFLAMIAGLAGIFTTGRRKKEDQ